MFQCSGTSTLRTSRLFRIYSPCGKRRSPYCHIVEHESLRLKQLNAAGGIGGRPLPLVRDDARFNDGFSSFDLGTSKSFKLTEKVRFDPMVEAFNIFNVTNILGVSNLNYAGYSNVLTRDSDNPQDPGYLRSSNFGRPLTAAGGVFGSGGPRAFQLAVKLTF